MQTTSMRRRCMAPVSTMAALVSSAVHVRGDNRERSVCTRGRPLRTNSRRHGSAPVDVAIAACLLRALLEGLVIGAYLMFYRFYSYKAVIRDCVASRSRSFGQSLKHSTLAECAFSC